MAGEFQLGGPFDRHRRELRPWARKPVRQKQRAVQALCQRPEMAKAIETLTPEGVSSNKQLVVKLVKGKHFFTLTQMYRLKNGI